MVMMMMMTINNFHYLRAVFCQVSGFIIFTASLQNTKHSRYLTAIQRAAPEVAVNNILKIFFYESNEQTLQRLTVNVVKGNNS
jgi:hypothetical protein